MRAFIRREKHIRDKPPDEIYRISNPLNVERSDDLEGEGTKIIIPSNIIDIWTRLEFWPVVKLSSHTDTLTEASNLMDELFMRGDILNEQQYRNAFDKKRVVCFSLEIIWTLQIKFQSK